MLSKVTRYLVHQLYSSRERLTNLPLCLRCGFSVLSQVPEDGCFVVSLGQINYKPLQAGFPFEVLIGSILLAGRIGRGRGRR